MEYMCSIEYTKLGESFKETKIYSYTSSSVLLVRSYESLFTLVLGTTYAFGHIFGFSSLLRERHDTSLLITNSPGNSTTTRNRPSLTPKPPPKSANVTAPPQITLYRLWTPPSAFPRLHLRWHMHCIDATNPVPNESDLDRLTLCL